MSGKQKVTFNDNISEKEYITNPIDLDINVGHDFLIDHSDNLFLDDYTLSLIKNVKEYCNIIYFLSTLNDNPYIDQLVDDLIHMGCEAIKSVDSKIIKQIYLQYDNYIEDVKYSEYIILKLMNLNNCNILLIECSLFNNLISVSYKLT